MLFFANHLHAMDSTQFTEHNLWTDIIHAIVSKFEVHFALLLLEQFEDCRSSNGVHAH